MSLLYVAGPIRPVGDQTLLGNLREAKRISMELWKMGHAVICPHANTNLEPDIWNNDQNGVDWIKGDLKIVARCDAVVVCPGWETSAGTAIEISFAEERHIPVHYYPDVPPIHPVETGSPLQANAFIDTIMQLYRVHLDKNQDYSPANILGTGDLGAVVRIWDKTARIMNLMGFKLNVQKAEYTKPKSPKNESLNDAFLDLTCYGIIAWLLRQDKWGK